MARTNTFSKEVTLPSPPESIRAENRVPDASDLVSNEVEKEVTGTNSFRRAEEPIDKQDFQDPLLTVAKINEEEGAIPPRHIL